MISALKGRIFSLAPGKVQVETISGMIITVLIPVSSYARLKVGEEALLYTMLKIKDEDPLVYGFLTEKEKNIFEKLISVTGVGGKIALSCLSAFSPEELVSAIEDSDVSKISSIPGIGKKTAQQMILDLSGKLTLEEPVKAETVKLREDLISGLVNLGYPTKGSSECISQILRDNPDLKNFEKLFKIALKKISRR